VFITARWHLQHIIGYLFCQITAKSLYIYIYYLYLKSALQKPRPHTRSLIVQRGANLGGSKFFADKILVPDTRRDHFFVIRPSKKAVKLFE